MASKFSQSRPKTQELRMVLVGKTGVGKSAAGNTILGKIAFESKLSSSTVTEVCKKDTAEFDDKTLAVVDTPGLFDTRMTEKEVKREIARCYSFAAPGPHVFLIVISLNRFTKEEQETIRLIEGIFGKDAARYTMVLFTHGDELEEEKVPIKKYVDENPVLCEFLKRCRGGYHVINNRKNDPSQIRQLINKIIMMILEQHHYTNAAFEEAEKAIIKEMEQLLRENPNMSLEEARKKAEEDNSFIWKVCAAVLAVGAAGVAVALLWSNPLAPVVAVTAIAKGCRMQ